MTPKRRRRSIWASDDLVVVPGFIRRQADTFGPPPLTVVADEVLAYLRPNLRGRKPDIRHELNCMGGVHEDLEAAIDLAASVVGEDHAWLLLARYVNSKRKPKPDSDVSLALAIRMSQVSERQVKRVTDGLNRTLGMYDVRTWRLSRLRRVQRALLNWLRPSLREFFQQRHEHHGQ